MAAAFKHEGIEVLAQAQASRVAYAVDASVLETNTGNLRVDQLSSGAGS